MIQEMDINGVVINDNVIATLKEIQENPEWYTDIVEDQIRLLLTKYEYLGQSNDSILESLADLNLLRDTLRGLI